MRLIDADELLKGKEDHQMISTHLIWNAPTVDAVPIKVARWKGRGFGDYECSLCCEITNGKPRYCPNCGADMRGEDNG